MVENRAVDGLENVKQFSEKQRELTPGEKGIKSSSYIVYIYMSYSEGKLPIAMMWIINSQMYIMLFVNAVF